MEDFLNNPEERIAAFSNSLNKNENRYSTCNEKEIKKRKNTKQSPKIDSEVIKETVQVRISQTIDRKIREIIWNIYQSTGEKTSMRDFLDRALLEYIENRKKSN